MTSRREFFAALFASLVVAPLVKAGLLKAPEPEVGVTIRQIRTYDALNGVFVTRVDILYGVATTQAGRDYQRAFNYAQSAYNERQSLRPEWRCVVRG